MGIIGFGNGVTRRNLQCSLRGEERYKYDNNHSYDNDNDNDNNANNHDDDDDSDNNDDDVTDDDYNGDDDDNGNDDDAADDNDDDADDNCEKYWREVKRNIMTVRQYDILWYRFLRDSSPSGHLDLKRCS